MLLSAVSLMTLPARAAATDVPTSIAPKRMDGINLEPVETYVEPKLSEFSLGLGVYPFDPYFYGLSLNIGYTKTLSHNLVWEVVNAQYYVSIQKDVTNDLASGNATVTPISPSSVPRLQYIIASDFQYIFLYGKFTSFEKDIRYFRLSALAGLGMVKTSPVYSAATVFGLKFQTFTRDSFSWNVEMRDNLAFTTTSNFMTFIFGASFSL